MLTSEADTHSRLHIFCTCTISMKYRPVSHYFHVFSTLSGTFTKTVPLTITFCIWNKSLSSTPPVNSILNRARQESDQRTARQATKSILIFPFDNHAIFIHSKKRDNIFQNCRFMTKYYKRFIILWKVWTQETSSSYHIPPSYLPTCLHWCCHAKHDKRGKFC